MKKILQVIPIVMSVICGGCSLDVAYDNQFADPDAITTPTTGRELLAYAYSTLPNPEFDLAVLTDDLETTYWASRNTSLLNQYNWQRQSLIDLAANIWQEYYSVIVSVNALLERIPDINATTQTDRNLVATLKSEAYTLKAYCYFHLLRCFAADPLQAGMDSDGIILKDKVAMENLHRSTIGECVEEIRRLLENAAEAGNPGSNTSWLTADATQLLLSEVELYAGNYETAGQIAERLLTTKGFGVFSAGTYRYLWDGTQCDERIFMYNNPDATSGFYQEIVYDTNSGDYFVVPQSLANDYASTDCRKEWSVCEVTTTALGTLPYMGKYNLLRREKREIMFVNKMRLSDALFVCLLAYAQCGKEDRAIELLNEFLAERGAPAVDASLRGDALLSEILHQKQLEYLGEGERFYDLKRFRDRILTFSSSRIPDADDYRWQWPLPKDEYLYNENVVQNPGWPVNQYE